MKELKISVKLLNYRDTAKKFLGERFEAKIQPHKHIINEVMKANKEGELEALLRISKTNMYQDDAFTQMLFMAATVELIEAKEKS